MPDSPSQHPPDAESPAAGSRRRHGNKPVFFVLGVIAAAVFTIGWGTALVSYNGTGGVSKQTIAWRIESDSKASITFEVSTSEPAVCVITATDAKQVEVGQTNVEVESGNRNVTASVDTVREATTVQVASCREQGSTK